MTFTPKSALLNAGFLIEEETESVSLIHYFQKAMEEIGCILSYDANVYSYTFSGNVVAAVTLAWDTPDGEYREDSVVWQVLRFDLDKQFAKKYRARLIELVLPDYVDEYIEDRCAGCTADVPDIRSPRHERVVLRCLGDVQSVLDSK